MPVRGSLPRVNAKVEDQLGKGKQLLIGESAVSVPSSAEDTESEGGQERI